MAFPCRALSDRLACSEPRELPWLAYLPTPLKTRSLKDPLGRLGAGEVADAAAHVDTARTNVLGQVWRLSKDPVGCREVQRALDAAKTDEERERLAFELEGSVQKAARCPHANHVLQKVITAMPPKCFQFVVDEVMGGGLLQMARHKYGCRIVQRLIEHGTASQVDAIVEPLLSEFETLAKQQYSNFVLQHLMEHSSPGVQRRLSELVLEHAAELGAHTHGCALLCTALQQGNAGLRCAIVERLMEDPELVPAMACMRHGHVALCAILSSDAAAHCAGVVPAVADFDGCSSRDMVRARLAERKAVLDGSKYGRVVMERLNA